MRSEFFGIVQTATLDDSDVQGMQAAKVRTNRFVLNWGAVEPAQGRFKWDTVDRFVGTLASHGIRAVPSIWGNPSWLPGSSSTPPVGGAQAQQQWRNFLQALVARYRSGRDLLDHLLPQAVRGRRDAASDSSGRSGTSRT